VSAVSFLDRVSQTCTDSLLVLASHLPPNQHGENRELKSSRRDDSTLFSPTANHHEHGWLLSRTQPYSACPSLNPHNFDHLLHPLRSPHRIPPQCSEANFRTVSSGRCFSLFLREMGLLPKINS
jgi:hypothetical protein